MAMRSAEEMLNQILTVARDDARIRAVLLNGSRANPHAPRDVFQDFDIVYFVTKVGSFAVVVAAHCGGVYPHDDDRRVSAHLAHVRRLPRDAQAMYYSGEHTD